MRVETDTHTHTFDGPFSGTTRVSRYEKGKTISILLKQKTMSGSGISWAICKSAPSCRQITMPATPHSVFYRPHALPAAQPTVAKYWRKKHLYTELFILVGISLFVSVQRSWLLETLLSMSTVNWRRLPRNLWQRTNNSQDDATFLHYEVDSDYCLSDTDIRCQYCLS